MRKKLVLNFTVILIITFASLLACKGDIEPIKKPSSTTEASNTYANISNQIADINPSSRSSLAELLGTSLDIDKAEAEGNISQVEANKLEDQLKTKFSSWIREKVDAIDPTKPESIKDFFDLQAVQRTSEYDESVDTESKEYKEEQMADKFNDWIRNRVDEINPEDEDALKDMFDLQVIQRTAKYDELATADTKSYKEEQMGQKLNEWVRNQVDNIDPTDPDNLKYFFWMQRVQANEKYDKFATAETHEYKESEMKRKFNEWVENRVNDLDPNDPDFLEQLEMLRAIQLSDKYDKFIATLMHEWKERTLKEKMDQYVENLVNKLNPLSPTFWEDLAKLIELQLSDVYKEVVAKGTRDYKLTQLFSTLTKPLGPPPMINGTFPKNGQNEVPLDQSIMIVFDQPMEWASLETAIEVLPATPFQLVSTLEETFIILQDPVEPLVENTTYTVMVNQNATSITGMQLLEPYEFSFTTQEAGAAPKILDTTPENGTIDNMAGQPITIRFDQRMSIELTESAISVTPAFDYSVIWINGDTTVIIQSHAPLKSNTNYSVTIGTDATSANGVPLQEAQQFGFTTGTMNLPQVLGTMPELGQVNIPPNHPIQIVFDRSMDTESVEALLKISPRFEYSTSWFEADMVLQIEPISSLLDNMTYTLTIDAGVLSSFGLPLINDYKFTFTSRD